MQVPALPRKGALIGPKFLKGPTLSTTRALIGQNLCFRNKNGSITRWPICEIEAYDGAKDKACHATRGKTPRNTVMFEPGGVWYVYLCYGVHELLNIVVGPKDYPAAALIRGAGGIYGPGRLTKALGIDRNYNALSATEASGLWLESSGRILKDSEIEITPRIGIDSVEPGWRDKPYRFWVPEKRYKAVFENRY